MVMGLIPVVGVPLPLISYGGTAMLTVMFGFGLLMSVYIHRDTRIGPFRREWGVSRRPIKGGRAETPRQARQALLYTAPSPTGGA